MARLGVFYAITDDELKALADLPKEERYDYMLEEIEEELLSTDRGCELDRAWEGIQLCLGGGSWSEENAVPANIVFGGEFLVDTEEEIITLKSKDEVGAIVDYLRSNDIQTIIRENYAKIDEDAYSLPKDDSGLEYLLGWSEDILKFYENALKENLQVIFTVDL